MNREERIKHMFYGWDEEKEILRFWKDEEIITIELKGVDKHQPS